MKTIFIGNPGTGKSTLLNGILQEVKFKSGITCGSGMTTSLQLERDGRFRNIWYGDTPGLEDIKLRAKAATEITRGLKSGDDDYKLIFVVTEEAGRARPADVATIKCVLDAIVKEGLKHPPYGVIINKLSKKMMKNYSIRDNRDKFVRCLCPEQYPTSDIHLYEKCEELEDEDNAVHEVTPELLTFLGKLHPVRITPSNVRDVKVNNFDEKVQDMQDLIKTLQQNNKAMEERANRHQSMLRKQMQEMEENFKRRSAELAKETEQLKKSHVTKPKKERSPWETVDRLMNSFTYNTDRIWANNTDEFTKNTVGYFAKHNLNVMVIHNDKASATGSYRRKHVELKMGWGFTKGYYIYVAPKGVKFSVTNTGDGGFINWCFNGPSYRRDGSTGHFY